MIAKVERGGGNENSREDEKGKKNFFFEDRVVGGS
jgi:hypothetical protein